ncbi:hypothetical protein CEXT_407621 [Caerostris extrusa]|uniref:Uncharacterized protein n=1 Tax=Caerostris extrusa TaxID=172846 RepID=A0AAV4TKM0_CAEEX|nr:hypothetical protein CEXT_407621 [Caerostris extrusa]
MNSFVAFENGIKTTQGTERVDDSTHRQFRPIRGKEAAMFPREFLGPRKGKERERPIKQGLLEGEISRGRWRRGGQRHILLLRSVYAPIRGLLLRQSRCAS